jgi:hypothetical protein
MARQGGFVGGGARSASSGARPAVKKRAGMVVAVVLGLLAVALAPAAGRSDATRQACTPGATRIAGQTVVVFCGPAKATVHFGARTIVYQGGSCEQESGMFTVNIGKTIPGKLKSPYPYFGLTVEGTHRGAYTNQNLAFAYRGRIYAIGQHTIVLKPGLHAGTFTGKSYPASRHVSG